jgi:hypothetical protein
MSRLPLLDTFFPDQSASVWLTALPTPAAYAEVVACRQRRDPDGAEAALAAAIEADRQAGRRPPPQAVVAAAALALDAGRTADARSLLERLVGDERTSALWRLRAAGALWSLGVIPRLPESGAPWGVVLEVATAAGLEVLAAWRDGEAAYAGADGLVAAAAPSAATAALAVKVVELAHELRTGFPAPRRRGRPRVLATGQVRITLLTPAGLRRREETMPRGGSAAAGAGESFELILEAQELMLSLRQTVERTPTAGVS